MYQKGKVEGKVSLDRPQKQMLGKTRKPQRAGNAIREKMGILQMPLIVLAFVDLLKRVHGYHDPELQIASRSLFPFRIPDKSNKLCLCKLSEG